ncbi:MAG: hypothetical protein EOM02_05605 [Synergistales bacterium]|nr:hypothetical protein [Synergistales bacterium]
MKGDSTRFLERLYRNCDMEGSFINVRQLPISMGRQSSFFMGSIEDVEKFVTKEGHERNLYFGVGLRGEESGLGSAVTQLPAVWVDVDAKDFGGDMVKAGMAAAKLPPLGRGWSLVVKSGGGWHCYGILKEPATTTEEIALVVEINRGLARRVGGDLRACDAARVLRLPGTMNRKYQPERPCILYKDNEMEFDLEELSLYAEDTDWSEYTPQVTIDRSAITENLSICMERCEFLKWCAANAERLPEPAWYAMISNLCRFDGSPSVIRELSRPYRGYKQSETDSKILHALDASGPITCEVIKKTIWDCGKNCGVKAPAGLPYSSRHVVSLGGENPFAAMDDRRKALTEGAIPESGFIRDYVDFASSLTDAPKIFHVFCGLTLLSSIVGRRAYCPGFGGRPLYPNLWTVLIAPSSSYRKTTAVNIAADFIADLGGKTLPQEFSPEMLIQEISSSPKSTFIWSEFGSALARFEREYMQGIKDILADLYDCPPDYTRKTKGGDFAVQDPYITMLGATNMDWMTDKKNIRGDMRGGFIARILFVPFTSKDYEMDIPGVPDEGSRLKLRGFLSEILDYAPVEFGISELTALRRSLNEENASIAETSEYMIELKAAFSRYEMVAMKLATLYAISMGRWGGEIPPEAMEHAGNAVRLLRESILDILQSVPLNRDDVKLVEVCNKMMVAHATGHQWIPKGEIVRYTHMQSRAIDDIMTTLMDMGRVRLSEAGYQLVMR